MATTALATMAATTLARIQRRTVAATVLADETERTNRNENRGGPEASSEPDPEAVAEQVAPC